MFDFVIPINVINIAEGLHDAFDMTMYTNMILYLTHALSYVSWLCLFCRRCFQDSSSDSLSDIHGDSLSSTNS